MAQTVRWAFAALVAVHGLIHLMGFAKAFGLAELPQLAEPVSRGVGLLWLSATIAFGVTLLLFLGSSRVWWVVGLLAVVLSQVAIGMSWGDAKFGTLANLVVLAAVVYGFASSGPTSFRASYDREVDARLAERRPEGPLTEADLAVLPEPVRRYVRLTGSVGQPRVRSFRATMRGRIRAGPEEAWMPFTAEQTSFVDEPSRFFHMAATRSGLPVDVLHAFAGGSASMRVRLLSLFPVVDAQEDELDRAETVTLFNDLCLFAPGALVDPAIRWEAIDDRSARGHYTVGRNTVSAVLTFGEDGGLVDFVSDDRLAATPDGSGFVAWRWSTPISSFGSFGPYRLMRTGEARWHPSEGAFTYIELEVLDVRTNVAIR